MPVKVIRSAGRSSSKSHKKGSKKQRAGAIYSFDLVNKIGGQATNVPLNGTEDGDCPTSAIAELGFSNYGSTRGGSRKNRSRKHKHSKKNHSKKNHSKKNHSSRKK